MDPRVEHHARILVEWSTEVKKGDMVIIRATPESHDLAVAVQKEVAKAGGSTVTLMASEEISRAFYDGANNETLQVFPKHMKALIEQADVYISLGAPMNTKALAGVDPKRMVIKSKTDQEILDIRLSKRWCGTVHPCRTLAQQAGMSMNEYQDFVYGATLIDWEKESKSMYLIKEHLEKHKDFRYVGP